MSQSYKQIKQHGNMIYVFDDNVALQIIFQFSNSKKKV